MASKTSKEEKRDEAAATAVDSMPFLVKLLEDHRDALSKEFKSAMTSLEAKLDFVLETVTDHAPELDRAHRALTAKPSPGSRPWSRPRAVIARIHHFRTKELIIQEARKRRGKLFFQGKPVAIFEDYCPEIVEQRAAYREVMSALYQRGLRPSLLYPARLRITTENGGKKHFASVEDAASFLETLQGNMSESSTREEQ
ncbi:hypothetical protein JOQ06_010697 [Pogonophryne albipinna]|uniref:LINE-1 type transposase domain-containing 1 n=1 Tax=Pogonophryne albipinna TaxID=1090488 RepID=A0AAD6AY78_9TELE|nr:hypothetical protein JOQ06_010697 [Pogonophryne albipinna]